MKIGGFGFIKDYLHISEAGYDFAELDIPEIEKLSEEAFEELKHTVRTGVPVLTRCATTTSVGTALFHGGL